MNTFIFYIFFWVVGVLGKLNDSCSFVDVSINIAAWDLHAESSCRID